MDPIRDDRGGESPASTISIDIQPGSDGSEPVVTIAGEIDVATSPTLRSAIAAVVEGASPVTIDLSATTFIDSSGLGVLVAALNRSRELGHDLSLRGLQAPVQRVFEITGLTALFAVEE